LQSFVYRCLRRTVKERWTLIITNDELRKQTNEIKITEQITRRKWNWICHTLRKENAVEKEAMEWNTQEQRKKGRPKRSWRRTIQEEALAVERHGEK
jgi:predicted ArsR family transcriptional regulator